MKNISDDMKKSAERNYQKLGQEHLEFLRKQHGRHKKDIGLKLIGNASNEKGIVGNGDYIFKTRDGKKLIASTHVGKDYLKEDNGQMYL